MKGDSDLKKCAAENIRRWESTNVAKTVLYNLVFHGLSHIDRTNRNSLGTALETVQVTGRNDKVY
jgi:hypothetical protein